MVLDRLIPLVRKGKTILREEGVVPFIKQTLLFLISPLFRRETYYIYEKDLNELSEFDFTPKIQSFTLKIVSTPEQVDELIAEGFDINCYLDAEEIKERISRRAVLFCVFVGKEFAHVTWGALAEKAKKEIDKLPFQVDFQKGEACSGASLTKPEYRGKGIFSYTYSYIFPYLVKQGFVKDKFTISESNISSQKAHAKFSPTITGKGRYLKLLWWEFWKEKPAEEIKQ